ncbi:MAG: L,D-transpeptidase family protein [Proteobacteria bacterium]|nr:L,D-transpeptidase family protein [Pseudomonadota bacterium]
MGVLIFAFIVMPLMANFSATVTIPVDSELIIVSKNEGLLRLVERKTVGYKTSDEFYVSYGQSKGTKFKENDYKTPTGVYFATSMMTRNDLPDNSYGAAATILNYPNPIDILLKKTGNGIWIHGTDDIERLSNKKSTRGCIILENKDLLKLRKRI